MATGVWCGFCAGLALERPGGRPECGSRLAPQAPSLRFYVKPESIPATSAFPGSNPRLGGVRAIPGLKGETWGTLRSLLSVVYEIRATRQMSESETVYGSEELLLIHESDAAPIDRPVRAGDGIQRVVAGVECALVLHLCRV